MTDRTESLVKLITSYLGQLTEQDLLKLFDLIRNTLDKREEATKKQAEDRRVENMLTEKELSRFKSSGGNEILYRGNIPATDPAFAQSLNRYRLRFHTVAVLETIRESGMNTAPYGIMVLPRYGADREHTVLDIFFGIRDWCDGIVTLDWDTRLIFVEVVDRKDGSTFKGKQPFGPTLLTDLRRIAKKYETVLHPQSS